MTKLTQDSSPVVRETEVVVDGRAVIVEVYSTHVTYRLKGLKHGAASVKHGDALKCSQVLSEGN
jgi:hypothetical protein